MKYILACLFLMYLPNIIIGQNDKQPSNNRVTSTIDSLTTKGLILKQTFVVNASISDVWEAYTTEEGWENWAVAIAEIDFKINGTIKTNYNIKGEIGDASTITLHILDYEHQKMIRLQAELTENFPSFMKDDEKELYNEIIFEKISPSKTRVISLGIGYKNNDKYKSLMAFFIKGNAQSYINLISYLETGEPSVKY